ncbi:MAG: MBL fold metallo-hydrolase RNA specificity domain-containing protein [Thermoanaerobaculia bacterium]
MKLSFFGAAGTVTGSRFLLEHRGTRLLVDCGLFQGVKNVRQRNWQPFPVEPGSLDGVVLTHAHIDHSGFLPALVRDGYGGPIRCTPATLELAELLLPDSARLQEEDAKFANRGGYSTHRPALPLYSEVDARVALTRLTPVDFDEPWTVGPLAVRLTPAGHLLGAGGVTVTADGAGIHFSGDLGPPDDLVVFAPQPPPAADWLVMEATYGDRNHSDRDPLGCLERAIAPALARGGVVLIPAFAVGRAQTILYCLWRLLGEGRLPHVPIYLDSPMATDATELYRRNAMLHRLPAAIADAAFALPTFVKAAADSKRVSAGKGPMIVISASGMATGGRVLHHLVAFAPRPETLILLPGYQAPGTRGASLVAGERTLRIHGRSVPVRAEVVHLDVFSAHADQGDLLAWLAARPRDPRRVFLVHGEPEPADTLRREIVARQGLSVHVAEHLETVELA